MKKILLVAMIALALGIGSLIAYNANRPNADEKQTPEKGVTAKTSSVIWHDFNSGLQKAASQNKPILVDFYTDWCHWCKVMDEKTFHDPKVAQKLQQDFIAVRINAEDRDKTVTYKGQTYSNIQLTQAFRITGYPSLGFLDAKGDAITVIPGFIPPETFINILGYIDQECYKKQISFEDYLKKKTECQK
ncbi:thioredoxin family protein [candidate division KSB1 bacterium]|nr:thioredoxin family protein [candidate division KSB1 bacterium]